MLYYGQFEDNNNVTCRVEIITDGDSTSTTIIGENGLYFGGEPITIETNIDDTFQHIILKSATINLVTQDFVGNDLFADNARDIQVKIYKANECVFAGYAEPNTFSQPYVNIVDEFSINCIDALSTLQYYNYKKCKVNDYNLKKNSASTVSLTSILSSMFTDLTQYTNGSVIYDRSKGINSSRLSYLFDDLSISELVIYGDTYDDIMTNNDLLEEILKYLNLHIIQHGVNFYIFDWKTIKSNGNFYWYKIFEGTQTLVWSNKITLTSNMHGDSDTSLSIADVFNQIQVNCDIEEQDTIIQNPLDEESLTSFYKSKQKYMTEYISEGSGDDANDSFNDMVKDRSSSYDAASKIEWFLQVMDNNNWKLYLDNGTTEVSTIYEKDTNGVYINQHKVPRYLLQHQLTPAIFRMGSVERKTQTDDNSPINKIDTKDYLYISVNGNENDTENSQSPTNTTIQNHSGMIEYVGNSSGLFSPVDKDTINYLVFSGKLLLQPIVYESSTDVADRNNNYYAIKNGNAPKSEGADANVPQYDPLPPISMFHNNLVTSDNNGEGRYYTRKFYTAEYPLDKIDENNDYYKDNIGNLQPWTKDKSAHGYEYNYTAAGDGTDKFSKLPILECELIIGDKRCVEINMDEYGNSQFVWVDKNSGVTQTYTDESGVTQTYLKTTFSLGVNPKLKDHIIGDEFDLQNTIDYTMNLDGEEGTAIPIRMEDNISGRVTFRILGPINLLWNDVTRRHPSFWRHTKWYANSRFTLAHTQNIIIKEFECKIVTNAGNLASLKDNDLVYCSAENDSFVNKKDDIEFKFITQLTSQEYFDMGVKPTVNLNSVFNTTTKSAQLSLYDARTQETAKAEEHYINQYYNEYSTAKVIMETTLKESNVGWNNIYHSNPLNKDFYVISINEDLRNCNKTITLKEV